MRLVMQLVYKELKLLGRDRHALALLFVMPAFFILVMSLAMRDVFAPDREGAFSFTLSSSDTTALAKLLADGIRAHRTFREVPTGTDADRAEALRRGTVHFAVTIPAGFAGALLDSTPQPVTVTSGPGVNGPATLLFTAAVREAVSTVFIQARLGGVLALMAGNDAATSALGGDRIDRLLIARSMYREGSAGKRPTSVQQNVPAWLVFAMFFVALPLSTTWLQERTQGTFARLRSFGISAPALLAGKLIPYLLVNVLQVMLMLAVGLWCVPALGGDALTLGHSLPALVLMTLAVGLAAVSYGLLVANLVDTTEQATILTGATNLLLGALGGVMVPKDIMPLALQRVSNASPMAWGLDGFLDVFLRDGDLVMVAPKALLLVLFALGALSCAALRLMRIRPY